jgi:hypothetical protein
METRNVKLEDLIEIRVTLDTLKNCACLGAAPRAKASAMRKRVDDLVNSPGRPRLSDKAIKALESELEAQQAMGENAETATALELLLEWHRQGR